MADEQADPPVTVGEEIQCLLTAGWAWDGDKLVHPSRKEVWTEYKRTDAQGFGLRLEHFEAELKQAARATRQRVQEQQSGGQ
jgi:hypothetical protein